MTALAPFSVQPTGRQSALTREYSYTQYPTGCVLNLDHNPVAWIVLGHHNGQSAGLPKTCTFIDVAYYRHTEYGINLETFEADTLAEAQYCLSIIFRLEVVV